MEVETRMVEMMIRMVEMMIRMVEMKDELVVGREMRVVGVITCMMIRKVTKIIVFFEPLRTSIAAHLNICISIS